MAEEPKNYSNVFPNAVGKAIGAGLLKHCVGFLNLSTEQLEHDVFATADEAREWIEPGQTVVCLLRIPTPPETTDD